MPSLDKCRVRAVWLRSGLASLVLTLVAAGLLPAQNDQTALNGQIERLTRQLNDDQADRRDDAEQALLKLAPVDNAEQCDAFLELLPQPLEGMPEEVRLRLTRLRREIETRQANQALSASRLSLSADGMDLAAVFEVIRAQTANHLSDHRDQFGQNATPRPVTIEIDDEEFWPAIDKILDQAKLSLYAFSGEKTLAVVDRKPGAAGRSGRASYAGPFRIEATKVVAQRNLRTPAQQGVRIELEIAWEPRLRPIALSQPIEAIEVMGDDGSAILPASSRAVLDVEVQPGSHSTELTIPLALPPRNVTALATFRGQMSALVPGRVVEFQFTDLAQAKGVEQQRGGVKVILDGTRKNQALWEVHMRVQVESEEAGLESHRGWVFQNITYLLNREGEVIDHVGFETTRQSKREVGLAYFFDLPDDEIGAYTWVYRTPAAIVRVPIEYELKDIPLP
ncbi:MAG: hypothetical protein IH898_02290 [Planctomycetes bacterium]|nr:hypothetical protein [Planctomycetota bacterium]